MTQIFEYFIEECGNLPPRDHIKFALMSPELRDPICVPWVCVKDFTYENILDYIEDIIQSNSQFYLHSGVTIVIKHVSIPVGET